MASIATVTLTLVLTAACRSNDTTTVAEDTNDDNSTQQNQSQSTESSNDTISNSSPSSNCISKSSSDDNTTGEPERLDDYLPGFLRSSDSAQQQAYYACLEQQAQDLIAVCMANEGFKYIPAVQPFDTSYSAPQEIDDADVDYASEHGFGITTGWDDLIEEFFDDGWEDPNDKILSSLSDSERQAYQETLYGWSWQYSTSTDFGYSSSATASSDTATEDPSDTATEDPPESEDVSMFGEGCLGQAYGEVYSFMEKLIEMDDLESQYMLLEQNIQSDPQMLEAIKEWAMCMAEQGYTYENPSEFMDEVYSDFYTRLYEITDGYAYDPFEGLSNDEIKSMSNEQREDLVRQAEAENRQNIDRKALVALQTEERNLAVANAECLTKIKPQMDEVERKHEAEFINQNRTTLEQLRDL